ncbi:acetyltransferase [Xylaria arbuscula]|nr:acetyltransferase [Xylaria arbuscula]
MSTTPIFHVRGLHGFEDNQFMIDAYDSTLPHLASLGSGGQWGSTKFAERDNAGDRAKVVTNALRYQETGEGDPVLMFIIEAEVPSASINEVPASVRANIRTDEAGRTLLPVGTVMLSDGIYPFYVGRHFDQPALKDALEASRDYIYVEALITDFRAGPWRKGAGAVLIEHSRKFARERGRRALYADAYSGNERKLLQYYENLGFSLVDYFNAQKPDGTVWPGAVLGLVLPAK